MIQNVMSCMMLQLISVYVVVVLLYNIFPKKIEIFLILLILLACAREQYLGILQLIQDKGNQYTIITGSFENPGPYGGFLAVCISLLLAFYLHKYRHINPINSITFYNFLGFLIFLVLTVAIILLPSTQSRSAFLGLGFSAVCWIIAERYHKYERRLRFPKHVRWLLIGVLIIVSVAAYLYKKPSADGRVFMDKICIMAILSNKGQGAGLCHFGGSYGEAQANYFKSQIDSCESDNIYLVGFKERERLIADCPDNAFNEFLFIGVEYGLIPMILFICSIFAGVFVSFKRDTIWVYGLVTASVFAIFSYPLHTSQFRLLLVVMMAASLADNKDAFDGNNFILIHSNMNERHIGSIRLIILLIALNMTVLIEKIGVQRYEQAFSVWKKSEQWYDMGYYDYFVEKCDTLMPYLVNDSHFLFTYGHSLNKINNYERSDSILQIGTKISSDPMFWNVMGNNSLALGRYREAEERYKHAFYMVPNRLYPLTLLAKLYDAEGDTVRFLKMADTVEKFVPKVESVNTERLRQEIRDIRARYTDAIIREDE